MENDPELDYAEAHIPDRWTIMGVRLLEFRAGHKLILQRVKSPFVTAGSKDFTAEDLIFALWVCSRPYKEAKDYQTQSTSAKWQFQSFLMALKFKDEAFLASKSNLFFQYLSDGQKQPIATVSDVSAKKTYAPSLMVLERDLIAVGFTDFLETPLRLSLFRRAGLLEKDGVTSWPEPWERGAT